MMTSLHVVNILVPTVFLCCDKEETSAKEGGFLNFDLSIIRELCNPLFNFNFGHIL